MSTAARAGALLSEVELALVAGRSLEQIEAEVLAGCELDVDSVAAMWLYAWSREDRANSRRFLPPTALDRPQGPGRLGD